MKTGALLLSFIMCGLGLALVFVYWNPWGFVLDGVGFMVFLYAIFSKDEDESLRYASLESLKKRTAQEKYKCGYCSFYEKPGCKRQEKFLNGKPCEDFMESPWE